MSSRMLRYHGTHSKKAITSGLLDVTIDGARGILFNITGAADLTLFEVNEAAAIIRESAHPEVNLIFGAQIDENLGDEVRITVVATGFEQSRAERRIRTEQPVQQQRPRSQQQPPQPPAMEVPSVPVERPQQSQAPQQPPAQQPPAQQRPASPPEPRVWDDSDQDIPAFLRRRKNN